MNSASILIYCLLAALAAGLIPLLFTKLPKTSSLLSAVCLGISGLIATSIGTYVLISHNTIQYFFPLKTLSLICSLRVDTLSGFFLSFVGLIVFVVALYIPGHVRYYTKDQSLAPLHLFSGLFIMGMYLVVVANDVFTFMSAWELMSVASYFLVAYQHQHAANRQAALIYLIMAHLSGLLILIAYAILIKFTDTTIFTFMHNTHFATTWAGIAFLFALLGFGMKAGIIPLHVWLPEAHPVAPSHISALMSGVMLKIAIYGLLRFAFYLLPAISWQMGILVLAIGVISALLGVLYALMQHNLKRLLAYHSVENIGIIFIGIGLAMIFAGTGHPLLSALSLIAALYHCLNHALFKSLLFLGAGAIGQFAHEYDLEHMGGLIRKMPHTAFVFLIGCISIAALPPFNGFVSEWLTFQAALQATVLQSGILRTLIPVGAAILALTGALAAACFVKVYGVTFLGRSRTQLIEEARDPTFGMRLAMYVLAALCLVFGILPVFTLAALNSITQQLLNISLPNADIAHWLWLVPIAKNVASYGAPLVFAGIVATWLIVYCLLHLKKQRSRLSIPWDCGFGALNARMQYTATAFAMPIRRVFQPIWKIEERVINKNYTLNVIDRFWHYVYVPVEQGINQLARVVAYIQGGNIRVYLAYVFCTLLFLLWIIS